jgi:hypothetical protein
VNWLGHDHQGDDLSGDGRGTVRALRRRQKPRPLGGSPPGEASRRLAVVPASPGRWQRAVTLTFGAASAEQRGTGPSCVQSAPIAGLKTQVPGWNAAQCTGRPLHPKGHPKILSDRSAKTAPQKASSGPTLARGASADPGGPDGEGQAKGQARNARGEPRNPNGPPVNLVHGCPALTGNGVQLAFASAG